jgi:hypothetical protein
MKPGPKPSSGKAMTHAERQARYRTKQAKACPRSVIANPQIAAAAFRDGAMPLRIYRRSKRIPGLARGFAGKHGGRCHSRSLARDL